MKFPILGRPPNPRNHTADYGPDHANDHGAQDMCGSPPRVQQPGGGPSEQSKHGENKEVPHDLLSP